MEIKPLGKIMCLVGIFKKTFIIIIFIPKKRNKQKIVAKPGGNRQQILLRLIFGHFNT